MDIKKYCKKEFWTKEKIYMAMKYVFSFVFILLSYSTVRSVRYVALGLTELFLIFVVSDLLVQKSKHFRWLNSILILILNVQYLILLFGGTFLTYVMLENINSIQDLGGKAVIYGIGVVFVLVCSFLPIMPVLVGSIKKKGIVLGVAIAIEVCAVIVVGGAYSPYRGVYGIFEQWSMHKSLYDNLDLSSDDVLATFYNEGILTEDDLQEETEIVVESEEQDFGTTEVETETEKEMQEPLDIFAKDELTLKANYSCNISKPNIILIFTEGMSESIVKDSRNIMQNVARMQNNSLNFTNYYNHTFATYRGLIGQLYSGYQGDDTDHNYLISIQSILKDQGYHTALINTEPANGTFSSYLGSLGFDEVLTDASICDGAIGAMSDGTAYNYLYDKAIALEQSQKPFFLVIYTFGTHASLDSLEQKFGDESDRVLNRFYNVDYQFGEFINKFNASALASDSIVVFTADHATYADQDFLGTFPDYKRACSDVDEIPFFIYSVGGPVGQVNADGRNSLDLAPTLLHYLKIDAPNYFLGSSLLYEKKNGISLDTFFYDPAYMIYTGNNRIETPNSETQELIRDALRKYFAAATQPHE